MLNVGNFNIILELAVTIDENLYNSLLFFIFYANTCMLQNGYTGSNFSVNGIYAMRTNLEKTIQLISQLKHSEVKIVEKHLMGMLDHKNHQDGKHKELSQQEIDFLNFILKNH